MYANFHNRFAGILVCKKKKNQYDDPPGAEYPPGAELCFKLGPIPQAFL